MNQVIQFLLENYGSLGVMIVGIAGLAFIIIKELKKSNNSLIQKQIEINKDTTNAIVDSLSKLSESLTDDLRNQNKILLENLIKQNELEVKRHNNNLISRRNVTLEINNLISDLRIGLNANRVSIIEFHNSFANQTGFPFLKFTVTYEKFAKGCLPLQNAFQGTQFGAISELCEEVINDGKHIYALKTRDDIENVVPILLTEKHQVNAAIFKGIFNLEDNMLIGLMCIEFCDEIPPELDVLSIISSARTIGELITLSKPK